VNGKQLYEPYIDPKASCLTKPAEDDGCTFALEITVPPGSYFMMGDNRDEYGSDDSRYWGTVPKKSVIGEAVVTYWPPKRVGLL
jgi:signal peptidase I